MFKERSGREIVFFRTHAPRDCFADKVKEGDSVILYIDNYCINIAELKKDPTGSFEGVITNFSPPCMTCHGLNLGQRVFFSEKNIFACSD